ncbi:ankyrin repeat-containing domain protein [Rhypophila decipiens]|uniref:Ankyrin repeat-containing domain protein n=1 Tax=Rhypophila decipiens TaxID=261697 RepID=A0AAN7B3R6_9PEZI|nr:ankyrin repeat-containing domain protein [Rhypophila decipiens]
MQDISRINPEWNCRIITVESSLINDLENHHGAGSVGGLQREALKVLLRRGEQIAQSLGDILIELLGEHAYTSGAGGESDRRNDVTERTRFALRKKLLWLRRLESVSQLRKMLRRTADDIALCLTMMNVKITAIHATRGLVGTASVVETSEANIIARLTDTVESSKEDLQNAIEGSAISVQESIQATIDRRLEESFLAMSTRAVRVEYSFPPWLMNAIFSMYFTHYGQPELLIRINRVVSSTEDCFTQSLIGKIWLNDLEAVKNILACCPSSVITVSTDGRSGLLHAITHRRTDITQVLLQAGADPFQQCDDGLSPALQALCLWLRGNDTNEIGGSHMIDIMPFSRAMEEDNFTELHRIVIGFLPIQLEAALANPTFRAQINSKTASGLTPLHLAAQYHKTTRTEIELLLAAGARTNDVTTNGHSPLSYACLSGNEAVVEALLEAGTSPPTAFTQLGPDPNVLDCLVTVRALCSPGLFDKILRPENGVDINGVNYWGITPITCAVGYDNFEAVGWLIEREADIDIIDPTGYTPLQSAIFWNAHQSARTLLGLNDQQPELASLVKKGLEQRYRYVNPKRGRGTCHSLAEVGDQETMEIFTELRMTGMPDVSTFRDIHGKTALDLFQARTGVYVRPGCYIPSPPEEEEDAEQKTKRELVEAWRKLLGSINQDPVEVEVDTVGNNNHIAGVPGQEDQGNQGDGDEDPAGDETDSDVEFFDAVEN